MEGERVGGGRKEDGRERGREEERMGRKKGRWEGGRGHGKEGRRELKDGRSHQDHPGARKKAFALPVPNMKEPGARGGLGR